MAFEPAIALALAPAPGFALAVVVVLAWALYDGDRPGMDTEDPIEFSVVELPILVRLELDPWFDLIRVPVVKPIPFLMLSKLFDDEALDKNCEYNGSCVCRNLSRFNGSQSKQ